MSIESRLADVEESLRLLRDAGRLQGRRVSASAPNGNDHLGWNATTKKWEPKASPSSAETALVADIETTASTSFTDLATAGPAVTVTTGTKALVIVNCRMTNDTLSAFSIAGYVVSGATTVAAVDAESVLLEAFVATDDIRASISTLLTLTAGSNTFTMKYRVTAGTGQYRDRSIIVLPV